VWRDQLARGAIVADTVQRAATLLARIQDRSADAPGLAEQFDDRMPLIQGRLDPFHRHVAIRHPELASRIEAEVERTLASRGVLVHGDYSPKNLIAYPDRVLLLDCEVAHWGDPAFDPAFLLCHLLLDGGHHPELAEAQANAAALAWSAYEKAGGRAGDAGVVAELGCVILARVDGKSPLPNLSAERAHAVRDYGRHLLLLPPGVPVEAALADSIAFLSPADQDIRS
jgi:5-methylthioribose kinase